MSLQIDHRRSSWLILMLVIAIGCVMMTGTSGATIDRWLMPLRFNVVDRAASGRVAIVEMDAASAAVIRRWPWSRSNYARVVDHLRQAGAASIVFDVDVSSPSDDAGDRAFAAALKRADGLIALPTFGQAAGSGDRRTIDAIPIPSFRRHAVLASVSIRPDADGQVRSMPFGTVTAGTPRPSLSAYIAARSGAADAEFPIDMSIDPGSIPRLSFVAVRDGRFDSSKVRGRHVLIGATAIEMGDRYATPRWGVIPGVAVQALAAETLLRGVPARGSPVTIFILGVLAAAALVSRRSAFASVGIAGSSSITIVAGVLVAQHRFQVIYPVAATMTIIVMAGAACVIRDVINRFAAHRLTDDATGLPNARALYRSMRGDAEAIIAVAQIDNYDALRAVLGDSAVADAVVRVSERVALSADGGTVYRTAERQLAFVLPVHQSIDDTLDGFRAVLLQPVEVGGRRADVAISLGVASGSAAAIERLFSDAALAAEAARASGVFWRGAAMDVDRLEHSISLLGELDDALCAGDIQVFYQPKYDLRDHRIASVEALVRWRHRERGFIGPDVFIPVAEAANRIGPLTIYVIERVFRDVSEWRDQHPGLTAAINISAKLLSSIDFNAEVERMLAITDAPASSFIFEVTESAAMSDTATAIAALRRYRDLGLAISMDDYGTGQSTLTYLRQLPLSELKIDRSFVQDAHSNHDDGVLVRSTIELAHNLGLKVVAEGVEDAECLAFLAASGCDLAQGYLISKPVPLASLWDLIDKQHHVAA